MNDKDLIELVGEYCKNFRKQYFNISLREFSKQVRISEVNLYAFENGKANNIKYLYLYFNYSNIEQRDIFTKELFNLL